MDNQFDFSIDKGNTATVVNYDVDAAKIFWGVTLTNTAANMPQKDRKSSRKSSRKRARQKHRK